MAKVVKTKARSARLIERHLAALGRALPEARKGASTGVHRARQASRRLRATLAAVGREDPPARRACKSVRRLTRLLGPVREMDVALAMLEVEGAQAGVPRASTKAIRHVLRQERRRRLRALKDGTGPKAVAKLRARVRNAIHGRHVEAGDVVLERRNAWRYAGELASGLEDHLGRAGRRFSPARLHGVRIATKKLRYALEVVDALEPAGRVKGMQTLRTVQRQLGRLHDVDLLRRRTRDILKTAGALDERGAGGLDRLERHLDDEARRAHASYLESAEALGVVCEQAKEGAARQTDSGY